MSKSDKDHTPITKAVQKVDPPVAATVCSVCGQGDNLTGSAGVARWHEACEATHPAVIAKVKARA